MSALESLLFAKYQMYRNVYWHHAVRSATCMFKRAVRGAVARGSLTVEAMAEATDDGLMELLITRDGNRLAAAIRGRRLHKRALDLPASDVPADAQPWVAEDPDLLELVEDSLAVEVGLRPGDLLLDFPARSSMLGVDLPLRTRSGAVERLTDAGRAGQLGLPRVADELYRSARRLRVFVAEPPRGSLARLPGLLSVPAPELRPLLEEGSSLLERRTGGMTTRRTFLVQATGLAFVTLTGRRLSAGEPGPGTAITVYKSASCGCCAKWVDHLKANGFAPTVHDEEDMDAIKRELGVPGRPELVPHRPARPLPDRGPCPRRRPAPVVEGAAGGRRARRSRHARRYAGHAPARHAGGAVRSALVRAGREDPAVRPALALRSAVETAPDHDAREGSGAGPDQHPRQQARRPADVAAGPRQAQAPELAGQAVQHPAQIHVHDPDPQAAQVRGDAREAHGPSSLVDERRQPSAAAPLRVWGASQSPTPMGA